MAFGFPPKYIEDFPLENLSEKEFLIIALESAKALGWKIIEANEAGFSAQTNYIAGARNERVEVNMINRTPRLMSKSTAGQINDNGGNARNIKSLIAKVNELQNSFSHLDVAIKYNDLKENPIVLPRPKFRNPLNIFIPSAGYFVTPILIDLNIAVYLIMVANGVHFLIPNTEDLVKWGGNFRPLTLEGQWWRLITCCFLHAGIFHLVMNMLTLFFVGFLLEPKIGSIKLLAAYLFTGITASLASVYRHELLVSVGASGAIFGLFGVFIALLSTNFVPKSERSGLLKSMLFFVGYNLLAGARPGIDNAAHVGGLMGGLVMGYLLLPGLKYPQSMLAKLFSITVPSMLAVGFLVGVNMVKVAPNDAGIYLTQIKKMVPLEQEAMAVMKHTKRGDKAKRLSELKEKGIGNWDAIITLVNNLDTLKLPETIHARNKKLLQYCGMRIRVCEFVYQNVEESTSKNHDSINWYNKRINALLDSLSEN